MKKIFFSLLLIWGVSPAFAQTVKFGISGGLNESELSVQNSSNDNKPLTGFHAGIFSDIDFGKFSIQPGLFYTTKGEKDDVTPADQNASNANASFNANSKITFNYLELPVNVVYNIPVKAGKFFIGGGPYLAYGLSGKGVIDETITDNGTTTTSHTETNTTFGSAEGDIKRFDFGLGAIGGFALKNGISINVGYEHGLTNINNDNNEKIKTSVFTVSLGYSFL